MYKKLLLLLFTFCLFPSFQQQIYAQKTEIQHEKTIRVLAIGNSFSEDAIENYLYELAAAAGKKIVVGNLYIGGAPLDLHLKNIQTDSAVYRYTKINSNGERTISPKERLSVALKDEAWDYISFQQASSLSGKYETYVKSLPALYDSVTTKVNNPNTKYILHQTWAYQGDSKHAGFAKYDNSQSIMYQAITATSKKVFGWKKFEYLIPAGTAIQNARTSSIGDHFTRDGYHLNKDYGRLTAASTWYEILFKENVMKNSYLPANVSPEQVAIAKQAAHKAVSKPYKITKIK